MSASNAIRSLPDGWELGDVIHTPSTIGKVGRGAQAAIACDWFQATMPSAIRDAVVKQLASVFGAAEARGDIPKEMRCYRECLQFPNGARLYQANRYNETCCLVISGKAKPTGYFRLLTNLSALGLKITRMDLAFDDRRGVLSLNSVGEAVDAGNAVSRWKESSSHTRTSLTSGTHRGHSIQFGSKASASYLVAYDKGLEMGTDEEGEWVRWELRLSDSEAEKFAAELFSDFPQTGDAHLRGCIATPKARGVRLCYDASDNQVLDSEMSPELLERFKCLALNALKSRLSFRERATASNVSRAKFLPWWDSFLEYFDPHTEDISSQEDADYEGGQSLSRKKMRRETVIREQAEEILTEIFEEHFRPHVANYFAEQLRNIPEYGEPAPESGAQGIDDAALVLVGLLPIPDNNVIPFPLSDWRGANDPGKALLHRSADVVRLETGGKCGDREEATVFQCSYLQSELVKKKWKTSRNFNHFQDK